MTVDIPEPTPYRTGYSTADDMLLGDLQVSSAEPLVKYIALAADEIDVALAPLYVTPIEFKDKNGMPLPNDAPGRLALKNISARLATGRYIMASAAAASKEEVQQYGLYLLQEALAALRVLAGGDVILDGAEEKPRDPEKNDSPMLPLVMNVDAVSQVDAFYGMTFNGTSLFTGR